MKKILLLILVSCTLLADVVQVNREKKLHGKQISKDGLSYFVTEEGEVVKLGKAKLSATDENDEDVVKSNPIVVMYTMFGNVTLELFEDDAPNTVANFINLIDQKYYQGVKFHRIIQKFMAQGGDMRTRKQPVKPLGYYIKDEFSKKRKHNKRGILSMANAGPNTNCSQFFICFVPTPHLDNKHTVFGQVISGFNVLDKLEKLGQRSGKPSQDIYFSMKVKSKRKHKYITKKIKR